MSDSKFEIIEHEFKGQHFREYAQGTVDANKPPVLKAKQYIPKSNPNPQQGDVTIIAAIGVGLVKVSAWSTPKEYGSNLTIETGSG